MRANQAMGRAGTTVIPRDWGKNHSHVASKTMTAKVNLRKSGSTLAFDDTLRRSVPTPHPAYATEQDARVQAQTTRAVQQGAEQAEETLQVAGYLVTLTLTRPLSAEPEVGDMVDVTESDDPLLTGRSLKIGDVVRGSVRFERDLFCTLTESAESTA